MKYLILTVLSVFFIQSASADGGTTAVDLSPDILKTSKSNISIDTQFGKVQVKTSDLRKLMTENMNKIAVSEMLRGLSLNQKDFYIQQSQNIKVSGVPATYSAELLTLTSGGFTVQSNGSKTIEMSSVKTSHMLMIDCQCE